MKKTMVTVVASTTVHQRALRQVLYGRRALVGPPRELFERR